MGNHSVWAGKWLDVSDCISEPSGGKSQRGLDSLNEGTKRKTQVKGRTQRKGLSDGLLIKVEKGIQSLN